MDNNPDSKVHGSNMGPIWVRQDPGGSHVGSMNFAIWEYLMNYPLNPMCVGFLWGQSFLYARLKNVCIMPWQFPSVCPSVRPPVRVFRTFLQHALKYQFETWYIHSVGDTTCRVWVASQLGRFDPVNSQKLVKSVFTIMASWIMINSSNLVQRWTAKYFST